MRQKNAKRPLTTGLGKILRQRRSRSAHLLCRATAEALENRRYFNGQYFFDFANANAEQQGSNFALVPALNDGNYQTVANDLSLSESEGYPLAVRIIQPLIPGGNAITQVLNKFMVQYICLAHRNLWRKAA